MIARRNRSTLPIVLANLAPLVFFDVAWSYVMPQMAPGARDAAGSTDSYNCFLCTSLFTLELELPHVYSLRESPPGDLLPLPEEKAPAHRVTIRRVGARSPPTALV